MSGLHRHSEGNGRTEKEKRRYYAVLGITLIFIAAAATAAFYLIKESRQMIKVDSAGGSTVPAQNVGKHLNDVWAEEILEGMSLEEKVSQMFLVRCPQQSALQMAAAYQFGGYILFGRDFDRKTPDEVKETIEAYQDASEIDMLIGVDEEGGTVSRISGNLQYGGAVFKSPQALYEEGGWERIALDTRLKADLLESLGINVNLAPVCDVSTDPTDYIYDRTFGKNAAMTAEYVKTVVQVMKEERIGSVLKHFPGYGNNQDTHQDLVVDTREMSAFEQNDFLPFEAGIKAGSGAVMVSHTVVTCMDPAAPASLSGQVHQILRQDLQFQGVIMTDDLSMDAITRYAQTEDAAVLAVEAGNDLICCTDFEVQIPAVYKAVTEGRISQERIDESVLRILKWKLELGVIPPKKDFRPMSSFFGKEAQWPSFTQQNQK